MALRGAGNDWQPNLIEPTTLLYGGTKMPNAVSYWAMEGSRKSPWGKGISVPFVLGSSNPYGSSQICTSSLANATCTACVGLSGAGGEIGCSGSLCCCLCLLPGLNHPPPSSISLPCLCQPPAPRENCLPSLTIGLSRWLLDQCRGSVPTEADLSVGIFPCQATMVCPPALLRRPLPGQHAQKWFCLAVESSPSLVEGICKILSVILKWSGACRLYCELEMVLNGWVIE